MEKIKCEMCGSNDIIDTNGLFVCQNCGTKYIPSNKKSFSELPKPGQRDKLQKLYQLARRARQEENAEKAERYYALISEENPDNWEAYFYAAYYKAMQTSIADIGITAENISNTIRVTFDLLKETVTPPALLEAIHEVYLRIMKLAFMLASASANYYRKLIKPIERHFLDEVISFFESISLLLFKFGDDLESAFENYAESSDLCCQSWHNGLITLDSAPTPFYSFMKQRKSYKNIKTIYINKIKSYNRNFDYQKGKSPF